MGLNIDFDDPNYNPILDPPAVFSYRGYRRGAVLDSTEVEKKPYHFGGYVEFKPVLFGLDHAAAFYKLRFYNDPQGRTLPEWNGRVQLEGSYEKDLFRLYAKTNTDLKYGNSSGSERSVFYEAYGSMKPSSVLKTDVGKVSVLICSHWAESNKFSTFSLLS